MVGFTSLILRWRPTLNLCHLSLSLRNIMPKPKANGTSYYAVRKGRVPGIYNSWPDCQDQVKGFCGPIFKKFATYEDALNFVNDGGQRSILQPSTSCSSQERLASDGIPLPQVGKPNNVLLETMQQKMEQMQKEILVLSSEVSCLSKRVTVLDSTVFSAPGTKRAFHASSKHDVPRSAKHSKLDREEERFTGSPFPDTQCSHVYTDGGCFDNGRNGARAGIGVFWDHGDPDNVSERLDGRPTNNRAEIHAAVRAVQIAKRKGISNLVIHTDSQFLISGITKWIKGWKKNGWVLSTGKPVINREDFEELDQALKGINVKWVHVRGHSGDPSNEAVDCLAKQGAGQPL